MNYNMGTKPRVNQRFNNVSNGPSNVSNRPSNVPNRIEQVKQNELPMYNMTRIKLYQKFKIIDAMVNISIVLLFIVVLLELLFLYPLLEKDAVFKTDKGLQYQVYGNIGLQFLAIMLLLIKTTTDVQGAMSNITLTFAYTILIIQAMNFLYITSIINKLSSLQNRNITDTQRYIQYAISVVNLFVVFIVAYRIIVSIQTVL